MAKLFDIAKDISMFAGLLPERKKRFSNAPADPIVYDYINVLARRLHPDKLSMKIESVKDETKSSKTFRFVPDTAAGTEELPVFRAGQYLSFREEIAGVKVTRPYSISSSPMDAHERGFMEITVRKKEGGFMTEHIWNEWAPGREVESSAPCGFFYYDSLRDTNDIVALAGGCGITPFRSMMKDFIEMEEDVRLTLLYGIMRPDEIIYREELESLQSNSNGRLKAHFVCSEPDEGWNGPAGFLTADLIKELAGDVAGKTFFICGPQLMYSFLEKELAALDLPRRRVRREAFGEITNIASFAGYPAGCAGKTFEIRVNIGDGAVTIPGRAEESVLVAMERAGLAPPSQCRSGECGFCNSILMAGDIFVSPENDGRRMAGIKYGYFHPCASYPVSDIEIRTPRAL